MYKKLILKLTKKNKWVKIQPPCSGKDIETAEKEIGYAFPNELRELLSELNGDRYFLLSISEIVEQFKFNQKTYEEYKNEGFANGLKNLLVFAGNGCGDYYGYRINEDGKTDENVIYVWEHEEDRLKQIASNIAELIAKYYRTEI